MGCDVLREMEEVKDIWLTGGDHMIIAEMVAKSMDGLEEFHKRVEKMEGVTRVCPAIILKRAK